MAPVPDDVIERFELFATRAGEKFGGAVRARSLGSGSLTLPMLHVGPFSVVAADGLVIDIAPTSGMPARRWELGWDESDFAEAWFLLTDHLLTGRPEPGSLDAFVARVVAMVGQAGDVEVSTVQAEFDRVVTVTPHRHGALPFEVLVTKDDSVVVSGDDFGWWDLDVDGAVIGGSYRDGVHRLRPRQLYFLPYMPGRARETGHPSH